MKIKFSKRRLYAHLIMGSLWFILGITSIAIGENLDWLGYGYLVISSFDLFQLFFYNRHHQYLTLYDGTIKKNKLYGSKNSIDLNEIQEIINVKGNYILKSEIKIVKINIDLIDNESLIDLMEVLKNLNLPSEKTFLAN